MNQSPIIIREWLSQIRRELNRQDLEVHDLSDEHLERAEPSPQATHFDLPLSLRA